MEFYEYNGQAEIFSFTGAQAIPLEQLESKFENRALMTDSSSESDHTKAKKNISKNPSHKL